MARADIVARSVEISADPPAGDDIQFWHSAMCHVGLPRSRQDGRVYERTNGSASLRIEAGSIWNGREWVEQPLPYGPRPRLIMMHIMRAYHRTGEREIDLGESLTAFMRSLGIASTGGRNGSQSSFKRQMMAFVAMRLMIGWRSETGSVKTRVAERVVSEFEAWLGGGPGGQRTLFPGSLTISEEFARSIEGAAVPLDARAIRALQDSALALDIYSWLAHRLWRLPRPLLLHWSSIREQFGQEYRGVDAAKDFKRAFQKSLRNVLSVYPDARVESVRGGLVLRASRPPVPPKRHQLGGVIEIP